MQGFGAGRSEATTRALEIEDRHRSPTIVVSDLCNVTSLMGHSCLQGVTAKRTLERRISWTGQFGYVRRCRGIKRDQGGKADWGKLATRLRHRFESWSLSEG